MEKPRNEKGELARARGIGSWPPSDMRSGWLPVPLIVDEIHRSRIRKISVNREIGASIQ
jgi:hypothetical protein